MNTHEIIATITVFIFIIIIPIVIINQIIKETINE